jgi:hypothetical protein
MGMVFVVNAAGVGKDLGLEPFPHFRGRGQTQMKFGRLRELKHG